MENSEKLEEFTNGLYDKLENRITRFVNNFLEEGEKITPQHLASGYLIASYESSMLWSNETGTFGQALESLKMGEIVSRKGWNGKGQFVFMRPEDFLPVEMVVNKVKSLPSVYKDWVSENYKNPKEQIKFTSYLCLKSVDGTIINGWAPSQTDMLSEDWFIVE